MHPDEWARVKTVFAAALDQPIDARDAFLDEACAGDPSLRDEVASLLAASAEPDQVLDTHALDLGAMLDSPGPAAVAGRRFGNYRILREIGRGGMGTVFLAERADGAFDHQVAIKIIRHTLADTGLEHRFRQERQILASLSHANIARLLDGGTTTQGEMFLVMEYVEGEALPAYASRTGLGLDARLALFQQVCGAVAYAHRMLVVHRDLTPSNILVTADGHPKLLDFGLATMVDLDGAGAGAQRTATTHRAFTPAYASPEQVRGDTITTASDVYSLGVVLYELLAGTRPFEFDHRSIDDIVRTLDSTPPPRPSDVVTRRRSSSAAPGDAAAGAEAHAHLVPTAELSGDLDTIVLKALRREPEQRYSSVEALAADIQRHRDGRPITASPHTLSYRASKFVARNRVGVAAAALVALSLVGGLAVSMWQATLAREQRDRANRRFDDVRKLSNSLLFELSPLIENVQGTTEARDLLLRRAIEYLDSLAHEATGDAQLQAELASGYEKVGDLQGNPSNPNLVEFDAAIASYSKARQVRQRLLELAPADQGQRRALARNVRVLGNILAQANEYDAAGTDLAEALRSFGFLLAEHPGDELLTLAVAQTYHDVGRNLSASKRYDGSVPYFEKAIAMGLAMSPSALEVDVARLVGDSHAQLGNALSWEGKQKDAEAEMAAAAAVYESLLARHPDDVNVRTGLWSTYWLTSSVYEEQDDARSDAYAAKALAIIRPVAERDPANVRARQQLARSYSRLGQTAINTGRAAEAVEHLEQSCRILRDIAAAGSKNGRIRSELALALTRQAEAAWAQRQRATALARLAETVAVYAQLRHEFPSDRRSARNMALAYQLLGEIHEADATRTGTAPSAARDAARDAYRAALDILVSLRDQQALAEFDVKFLDKMTVAVARLP